MFATVCMMGKKTACIWRGVITPRTIGHVKANGKESNCGED